MDEFKEKASQLKSELSGMLKSDMPKEAIDKIASLSKITDELIGTHEKLRGEHTSLQEDYIQAVKRGMVGGTPNINDDIDPTKPGRSFEEIAEDIIKNRKK